MFCSVILGQLTNIHQFLFVTILIVKEKKGILTAESLKYDMEQQFQEEWCISIPTPVPVVDVGDMVRLVHLAIPT